MGQALVSSDRLLLIIAYGGFLSLGLPDTLIGVAWPSVRNTFGVGQSAIALVFFGGGCSYFLSSFFTGKLLSFFNVGSLLAASSALVALSGLGYAFAPAWMIFAAASLVQGLGSGAIDAGLNNFVSRHFSARHMNWLHASYSLGAMIGPLIMTAVITRNGSWRVGYLIVALILLSLAGIFASTRHRWSGPDGSAAPGQKDNTGASMAETFRHPIVWLQIMLFFVYTGLEVTIGQWSFTILTESRQFRTERAGVSVASYWASILAGRIVFGVVVDRLGIDRLLRLSIATALLGTVLFGCNFSDSLSATALVLAGLGLAVIYPCMMTRTPQRLGNALAAHAIGFQVSAAMLGAAACPSLAGYFAQRFGLEAISASVVGMAVILCLLHETLLIRSRKQ